MDTRLALTENKLLIFLSGMMVWVVAAAVGHAGWTEHLNAVVVIGLGAVVIGLLISRSLLPPFIAHLFSMVIGAGWAFWRVSRLLPAEMTWDMRWQNMVERIAIWLTRAVEGGVSYDNLMFILQMGLIVWLMGYLTIWFLFRSGQSWSAILPGGAILLIVFHYAPEDLTGWVFAFIVLALLLIIHFNLMEHERRWRADHVFFRSDVGFSFLRDGLIFSLLIVILAWNAPRLDRRQAVKIFGRLNREWRVLQNEWNRMFASLNYKPNLQGGVNAFGQSLTLSGPRYLTAEPIMLVKAPGGRYWRAAVYDEYTGFGWRSNDQTAVNVRGDKPVSATPLFRARIPLTQTFTLFKGGATVLYAMGNPVKFDRGGQAKVNIVTPAQTGGSPYNYWAGKSPPWWEEITYFESDVPLLAEEPYRVVSMVSVATEEQLRSDADVYPDWIASRYLQLPDGIPQRVFDLAAEITTDADNPYDKATAIERYLRTHIAYNELIDPPPPGRDKVDYILFDLKEAYCDYYATSMIVMLRSLGIPARLAAGYARGRLETLDNQERAFLVQNKDAHSWVEVFFPTYGWIEFEPTAAQPIVTRYAESGSGSGGLSALNRNPQEEEFDPLERAKDIEAGGDAPAETGITFPVRLPFWGEVQIPRGAARGAAIGGALLLAAAGGWSLYSRRRESIADARNLPPVGSVYEALLKLSAWMGLPRRPAQTPFEHARRLGETLPEAKPAVDLITAEYVHQSFSRAYTTPRAIRAQMLEAWNDARPILYRAIFERRNPLKKIRLPFRW